jgi:hypothetical protein
VTFVDRECGHGENSSYVHTPGLSADSIREFLTRKPRLANGVDEDDHSHYLLCSDRANADNCCEINIVECLNGMLDSDRRHGSTGCCHDVADPPLDP